MPRLQAEGLSGHLGLAQSVRLCQPTGVSATATTRAALLATVGAGLFAISSIAVYDQSGVPPAVGPSLNQILNEQQWLVWQQQQQQPDACGGKPDAIAVVAIGEGLLFLPTVTCICCCTATSSIAAGGHLGFVFRSFC